MRAAFSSAEGAPRSGSKMSFVGAVRARCVRAVSACQIVGWLGAVVVVTALVLMCLVVGARLAEAAPCSDAELAFARGTFEPAGIGATGAAFVDALRSQVGGKSVDVYAVNYPGGADNGAHNLYAVNGMAGQAANFAAHHVWSTEVTA
jgi:Cutinase